MGERGPQIKNKDLSCEQLNNKFKGAPRQECTACALNGDCDDNVLKVARNHVIGSRTPFKKCMGDSELVDVPEDCIRPKFVAEYRKRDREHKLVRVSVLTMRARV